MEASTATTCYRHSDRETGVSCSSCGRPICPECMTPTPVGMRCPECSRQTTKVRTAATIRRDPQLTYVLMGLSVIAFVATMAGGGGLVSRGGGEVIANGALFGPAVADGEWWRIVTAGFLHAGLLHLAFNMYFLYFLGTLMEPVIGKLRFGIIYFVSLFGGSFGALLLTPDRFTVGASGAVFGLMGAAIIAMRVRGIDPMQSGLGMTLLLNLGITFLIPGISIGGHLGGLVAGGIVGVLMFELAERRRAPTAPVLGACVALAVVLAVGCVAIAGSATGL
ncbi:MAG TPA: rhomboid family intramembrane serine protease [Solirubrobacteraceae bacterium]|nr:rhomboid family intramembrane serine protease [Solirubrobacteraceae bacterium]